MTAPGWYPDTASRSLRWWDGQQHTAHTAPSPPGQHDRHRRADGSVRGPGLAVSLTVLLGALALFAGSAYVVGPALTGTLGGRSFATPGSRTLTLDEGEWVVFQRTGTVRGTSNFTVSHNSFATLIPEQVSVTGPGEVSVAPDGANEFITRNDTTYTSAVRFDVPRKGTYTVTVHDSDGQVIVARSLSRVLHHWPWILGALAGAVGIFVGGLMTFLGSRHRRAARS